MARRDPFARLKQPITDAQGQPMRPIDLIRPPTRKRRRDWEKANRPYTYKIPTDYHSRARAVREAILGLAQRYQTTMDDVAAALMKAALAAVQEGEIELAFAPNPKGRKMTVEVVSEGGWAQEELPKPQKRKRTTKPLYLGFRWSKKTAQRLGEIANDAPKGAVVVLLLEAALERVKAGKWGLRPRPVEIKQTVEVANFAEKPKEKKVW